MASPKLWCEVWRRPGHATFQKVIADVPVLTASGTVPVNGIGEGRVTIPKSYGRLDEILKPDVTTPANAVSSLVRVFSENSAVPIYEFIPAVFTGEQDKADPDIEIAGPAIGVVWGYARVEAWDWTGIDDEQSKWPDWIWGGRNVLGDLESGYKPAVTKLYRQSTVTGGTFTIGVSFNGGAIQTTAAIAWNATAATVDTELTALSNVTSLEVSGSGSESDPWRIQTISPEGEYVFSVNSGSLVGGLVLQDRESIGVVIPQGWTTSFNPINNLSHGSVSVFRATDFTGSDPAAPACDTTGVGIAFDGDTGQFPGIQKITTVKPGGRYYATVTAYAQGAAGTYRLVIRDLLENGIAVDPSFDSGTTLVANTWTTFTIPIVTIPDDVDRVIFRFASVGTGNPPLTFVACLELREGMPPTTWGDILTQLWLDATSDHAGRQVWQIGAGVTNFLTLDFDATLDSGGAAWADPEVSITLKRGQSYLRVIGEAAKMGYEWRIVPNSVPGGTWLLQVFNIGTMGVDHTAIAAGPSIQGGRDVTRRDLRRFLPPATDTAVEAGGQRIARSRNASAITALGRIEQYIPNQDLGSLVEAALSADQAVAVNLSRSQSLSYVLTPTTLDPEPLIAYAAADTIYVLDPPDVPVREARRIKSLGFAWTKDRVEYPIQLESDSYVGSGAIAQSVDFLLKEFKAIREQPDEPTDLLNFFPAGGTGTPTVVIAASNATELSQGKADFVCTGTADEGIFNLAMGVLNSTLNDAGTPVGGRIILTEGDYYLTTTFHLATSASGAGLRIEGMGSGATKLHMAAAANVHMFAISHAAPIPKVPIEIVSLQMDGNKANQTAGSPAGVFIDTDGSSTLLLSDVYIHDFRGYGLHSNRSARTVFIDRCRFESNTINGLRLFVEGFFQVTNSEIGSNTGAGIVADGANLKLVGCNIRSNGGGGFSAGGVFEPSGPKLLAENQFSGNTGNGISLDGVHAAVIGNFISANTAHGISAAGNQPLTIVGNVIDANSQRGASLSGGSGNQGGVFSGNVVKDNLQHGIYVGGPHWQVNDNRVEECGQATTNTYDGIHLDAAADDCEILINKIRQGSAANKMRYGINILAGATANWIAGNRAHGTYGTGTYNDAGTATINVWVGAFGDNQP